jgi:hypothetical protein
MQGRWQGARAVWSLYSLAQTCHMYAYAACDENRRVCHVNAAHAGPLASGKSSLVKALAGRGYSEQLHGRLSAAGSVAMPSGEVKTLVVHEVRCRVGQLMIQLDSCAPRCGVRCFLGAPSIHNPFTLSCPTIRYAFLH